MTGIVSIVLAITPLFTVYSYETPYTHGPVIEAVANCDSGQLRITDADWTKAIFLKKKFIIKDKRGDLNTCLYNKKD